MQSFQNYNNFEIETQKEPSYFNSPNGLFQNTRLGFIQKVYGILTCQLLFTVLFSIITMTSTSFSKFQIENYGILIFCIVMSIVIMLMLMCCESMSKTVPWNYVLLGSFTFCESWIVSTICGMTNPKLVLMAAVMTLGIVISLTVYSITTKTDFTTMGGMMYVLGMALLLFGLFALFTNNRIVHIIISSISVIILGVYLVYDTQLVIGNRKHNLEIDEYIIGALILYVDIITLFLELLDLFRNIMGND